MATKSKRSYLKKLGKGVVKEIKKRFGKRVIGAGDDPTGDDVAVMEFAEKHGGPPICVGGAFISFVNGEVPFPTDGKLAQMLQDNTPVPLSDELAKQYANAIIGANDEKSFNEAWRRLEEALGVRPRKVESTVNVSIPDYFQVAGEFDQEKFNADMRALLAKHGIKVPKDFEAIGEVEVSLA